MATDGPDPKPCDPRIFKHGKQVFVTHSIPSNAMEGWVKKVANLSGQPVDWHFFGGSARVLALGDIQKVEAAIAVLKPEHDALFSLFAFPFGTDLAITQEPNMVIKLTPPQINGPTVN